MGNLIGKRIAEAIERYKEEFAPTSRDLPDSFQIAHYIDHTILKPDATFRDIEVICQEARAFDFKAVCVNSCWIPDVSRLLDGTTVKKAVVTGFPLGACSTEVKVFETRWSLDFGAEEFDMVMNIGALKGQDYDLVMKDIAEVVKSARGNAVKVILETALLSTEEKVAACVIAEVAGAVFVKTSTGFAGAGATIADVQLMRFVTGSHVKIKASGGIRDKESAVSMIKAGADRIGTSSGIGIVGAE